MGNNTLRHLAMMYVNKPTTEAPDGESVVVRNTFFPEIPTDSLLHFLLDRFRKLRNFVLLVVQSSFSLIVLCRCMRSFSFFRQLFPRVRGVNYHCCVALQLVVAQSAKQFLQSGFSELNPTLSAVCLSVPPPDL